MKTTYLAHNYRWEETCDPQIEDQEEFDSLEEAENYLENLLPIIGFSKQIDKVEDEEDDWTPNKETIFDGDVYKGESIIGKVIVQWSWEKHVGYCRNLLDIGIAGSFPFHNLKTEEDLITGNEDRTFRSNFSILLSDNINLENLETELNMGHWKWNGFKNNPSSVHILEKIEDLLGL